MNYLTIKLNKQLKKARKVLLYLLIILLAQILPLPTVLTSGPALADNADNQDLTALTVPLITPDQAVSQSNSQPTVSTPQFKVISTSIRKITAYNSERGQTDNTPCITANGFNLCAHKTEDSIAANFLDFGTKVRIPELFGDRVFVVRDRMNQRHNNRIDIWMNNKNDAIQFGVQVTKIEVLADAN